jgi:hypothetical protein
MGGSFTESCITDPRNMRMEETSWTEGRMEAPFEGDKVPEGVAAPYMKGCIQAVN